MAPATVSASSCTRRGGGTRGAALVEPRHVVTNGDRAVGARLGGAVAEWYGAAAPPGRLRAHFEGSAGQSFGAFLTAGVELHLVGEANDYVGKAMSGGRIVISPPVDDAGDPCLVGNTALYGATGGKLFCAGSAGERFAVRNSGAVAVVEGVGDHACEYMTAGTVVVLGDDRPELRRGHDRRRGLRVRPSAAARSLPQRRSRRRYRSEPGRPRRASCLARTPCAVHGLGSRHGSPRRVGAGSRLFVHVAPSTETTTVDTDAELVAEGGVRWRP